MGRIRGEIAVGGQKRWTLYGSGARHSYIVADAALPSDMKSLLVERTMALGGKSHRVRQVCLVFAEVEGHLLDFEANIVEEIGRDVLYAATEVVASESSGRPITFGETSTGKYIAVVFEIVDEDLLAVYPVTAYETEP